MIIYGITDDALRKRMLREPNIDLKKDIELGQTAEQTKIHAKQLAVDIENKLTMSTEETLIGKDLRVAPQESGSQLFRNCKFCAGTHNVDSVKHTVNGATTAIARTILPGVASKRLIK